MLEALSLIMFWHKLGIWAVAFSQSHRLIFCDKKGVVIKLGSQCKNFNLKNHFVASVTETLLKKENGNLIYL
jgi:hypothetical protein